MAAATTVMRLAQHTKGEVASQRENLNGVSSVPVPQHDQQIGDADYGPTDKDRARDIDPIPRGVFDGNGIVGIQDLLAMLATWGVCP